MPQLQLVSELAGHTDPAWQVTFNPTRPLLASCSTDKTFKVYSYTLPQTHTPSLTSGNPEESPNASSSSLYPSPSSAKPTFQLLTTTQTEHKRTIRSIAWDPSGRTLATGSFDSTVEVWEEVDADEEEDVDEGAGGEDDDPMEGNEVPRGKEWECVTTLEGHESECKGVAFSSDGGLLASCSRDKSVWVWEVQPDADFECIAVMMDHTQDVKSLAWHPKEEILASASYDSHIHLQFDDPDGDWCIFQKLHPKLPASALHLPDPSPALRAALEPTPEDLEVEGLNVPPLEEDETVWSLAWSPCGRYLASGGDMGGIRVWQRTGSNPDSPFKEILHTSAHARSVFSLSWSSSTNPSSSSSSSSSSPGGDLGLLASTGGDGKIIVWQISVSPDGAVTAEPIAAVRDAHGVSDVNSVGWCIREGGKGAGMLASCGDDGGVKVWRVVADE